MQAQWFAARRAAKPATRIGYGAFMPRPRPHSSLLASIERDECVLAAYSLSSREVTVASRIDSAALHASR